MASRYDDAVHQAYARDRAHNGLLDIDSWVEAGWAATIAPELYAAAAAPTLNCSSGEDKAAAAVRVRGDADGDGDLDDWMSIFTGEVAQELLRDPEAFREHYRDRGWAAGKIMAVFLSDDVYTQLYAGDDGYYSSDNEDVYLASVPEDSRISQQSLGARHWPRDGRYRHGRVVPHRRRGGGGRGGYYYPSAGYRSYWGGYGYRYGPRFARTCVGYLCYYLSGYPLATAGLGVAALERYLYESDLRAVARRAGRGDDDDDDDDAARREPSAPPAVAMPALERVGAAFASLRVSEAAARTMPALVPIRSSAMPALVPIRGSAMPALVPIRGSAMPALVPIRSSSSGDGGGGATSSRFHSLLRAYVGRHPEVATGQNLAEVFAPSDAALSAGEAARLAASPAAADAFCARHCSNGTYPRYERDSATWVYRMRDGRDQRIVGRERRLNGEHAPESPTGSTELQGLVLFAYGTVL